MDSGSGIVLPVWSFGQDSFLPDFGDGTRRRQIIAINPFSTGPHLRNISRLLVNPQPRFRLINVPLDAPEHFITDHVLVAKFDNRPAFNLERFVR